MKSSPWLLLALTLLLLAGAPRPARAALAQAPACTTARPGGNGQGDPTATVCTSIFYDLPSGNPPVIAVSWVSHAAESGKVKIGTNEFDDARGKDYAGTSHLVPLSGLAAGGTYQYDIVSGGVLFTNGGSHWSINNLPDLPTPDSPPKAIVAQIKNPDGTNADEALIYVVIRRANDGAVSGLLSQSLTPDHGGFLPLPLYPRSVNFQSGFNYDVNSDQVIVTATAGDGYASTTVPIKSALPQYGTLTLKLGSNVVPYATATPSPVPATSTPVPVTATRTSTLIPATATALAATATASATNAPPTFTRVPTARPYPTSAPAATALPTITLPPTASPSPVRTSVARATVPFGGGSAGGPADSYTPTPRRTATLAPANVGAVSIAKAGLLSLLGVFVLVLVLALGAIGFLLWRRPWQKRT